MSRHSFHCIAGNRYRGVLTVAVPVPNSLDEALSPTWLTAALQPRFPGIEVRRVTPGPVVDRISTNARFAVEYSGARRRRPVVVALRQGLLQRVRLDRTPRRRTRGILLSRPRGSSRGPHLEQCVRRRRSGESPRRRHHRRRRRRGGVFLDWQKRYTPEQAAVESERTGKAARGDLDAAAMGDDTVVEVADWASPCRSGVSRRRCRRSTQI